MTATSASGEAIAEAPILAPGPQSRVSFLPLSTVPDGDLYLVGNQDSAIFLAIPEIGVHVIQALQSGNTIAEAQQSVSVDGQEDVDVLDFVATLLESGLVTAIDDVSPASAALAQQTEETWIAGVRPEVVRPFFSRVAWAIYGALFALCVMLFLLYPQHWPSFEDLFFYPNPAISLLVVTFINILLVAGHESFHWLAGRAVGVAAQFRVSRRFFIPVFETDLSQLWSVPRQQRYSPFLAGMAFDTLVLGTCLGLRVLWSESLLDLPPLLYRLLGAIVLSRVFVLAWQTLVFLRTDLYAVLITVLGCYNLYRVNQLYLKSKLLALQPTEQAELEQAHPRDLQTSRWFGWLYLIGATWIVYSFFMYFLPSTILLAGWIFGSLSAAPVSSRTFWEALLIGLVAAFNGLLPLAILIWQRVQLRRGKRI